MKRTFIGTAGAPNYVLIGNFRGAPVNFALPFDVEPGTRVAITFETIDKTTGSMDDAEPRPDDKWAKRCEMMKAQQATAPKQKRPQTSYFYIGKKNAKPTAVFEGVRPCWPVRALQALVGIHWSKGGKIIKQVQANKNGNSRAD